MEKSDDMEPDVDLDLPSATEGIAEQIPAQVVCPTLAMGYPILNMAFDFTICDINSADDVRQAIKTISDAHKSQTPGPSSLVPTKHSTSTKSDEIVPQKRQILSKPDQNKRRKGRPKGAGKKTQKREDFYAGKLSNYVKFRK